MEKRLSSVIEINPGYMGSMLSICLYKLTYGSSVAGILVNSSDDSSYYTPGLQMDQMKHEACSGHHMVG